MAITIRNRQTENMIRRLGDLWGLGPSGVVQRLAEDELAREATVSPAEFERRMKLWDELMAMVPEFTEAEKQEMQHELDHMYDYLDEDSRDSDQPRDVAAE
jgi:hypothetical protein